MKKSLLLVVFCAFYVVGFARTEYMDDGYCIYKIDTKTLEAEVVNFCPNKTSIIVPSSFTYLGDAYQVVSICFKSFSREYDCKYAYWDFEDIRSKITELILPQSLKKISYYAFIGLSRLKSLEIPHNIHYMELTSATLYDNNIFADNDRLESVHFLGLQEIKVDTVDDRQCRNYVNVKFSSSPKFFMRMLNRKLKESCPNIKKVTIEGSQYYIALADSVKKYNKKLSNNIFNINDVQISDIQISPDISGETDIKQEYQRQIARCRSEFNQLNSNMEQLCRNANSIVYVRILCQNNPEFATKLDEEWLNHKCEQDLSKTSLALMLVDNKNLPSESCQEKLYEQYSNLFLSQSDFISCYAKYDKISDFYNEIEKRNNKIESFEDALLKNSKVNLKDIYSTLNEDGVKLIRQYKEINIFCHYPCSSFVEKNVKMNAEYQKNGNYFDSQEDFFNAYISGQYVSKLKLMKSK